MPPIRCNWPAARSAAAALGVSLLVGCGVGGPATEISAIGIADLGTETITGASGVELALSQWRPAGPTRAVILGLHGFGDFGPSTYGLAAEAWAARGIHTYAYDQRGFGRNPSFRQWPGVNTLVADLQSVAAALRKRHPGVPLIVAGHSMGGGIALAAAGGGLDADGLVLVAPAIAGGPELGPGYRFGGWLLAATTPDRRFTGEGVVKLTPTDNAAIRRQVTSHPRHFANPSGRELQGLIRVMDRAATAAPSVTLPVLTLMGRNDQLLRVGAVRRVHRQIPGRARFIAYDDGWHWLLRDLQAPTVWDDIASFVLNRT